MLVPGVLASGPQPSALVPTPGGISVAIDAASAPGGVSLVPTEDCTGALPAGTPPTACCQTGAARASYPFELLAPAGYVLAVATPGAAAVALSPLNASDPGPFSGVRYAQQGFPLCALVNAQGLPMAPFARSV